MVLKFDVKNQMIERTDNFKAVADSRNYLKATFSFSEEWENEITAIFGNGESYYNVILTDNACVVPWEVIKAPFFSVSVVCGDRITANTVRVEVERSGYLKGKTPAEPTPDVYAQILNSAKPPYIGGNGNWYVWSLEEGGYIDTGIKAEGQRGEQGEKGSTGEDGYTPIRGVDYWTDEDKAEIKSYVDEAILGGAW